MEKIPKFNGVARVKNGMYYLLIKVGSNVFMITKKAGINPLIKN